MSTNTSLGCNAVLLYPVKKFSSSFTFLVLPSINNTIDVLNFNHTQAYLDSQIEGTTHNLIHFCELMIYDRSEVPTEIRPVLEKYWLSYFWFLQIPKNILKTDRTS